MTATPARPPRIIRIPRTDTTGEDAFILGEVTVTGSKPLSVRIIATEGEEPYVITLNPSRLSDLLVANSPCSPSEWERILCFVLLGADPIEGIEAGAEAQTGKAVTVTIRRRIAGINQRLGTLNLPHTPSASIELFTWCGNALSSRDSLLSSLATKSTELTTLEAQVEDLKKQLDELTAAKKTSEDDLLEKFCFLLNEKKVKIREQQRLLSAALVDPGRVAQVAAVRGVDLDGVSTSGNRNRSGSKNRVGGVKSVGKEKGRAAGPSRTGKRKGKAVVSSSDDEDGFEKMDVDAVRRPMASQRIKEEPISQAVDLGSEENGEEEEGRRTPENDTETGSELDEDEEPEEGDPVLSYRRQNRPTAAEKGKGRAVASPPPTKGKGKGKQTLAVHPRRTAAPARKSLSPAPSQAAKERHRNTAPPPVPPPPESETESDDEL